MQILADLISDKTSEDLKQLDPKFRIQNVEDLYRARAQELSIPLEEAAEHMPNDFYLNDPAVKGDYITIEAEIPKGEWGKIKFFDEAGGDSIDSTVDTQNYGNFYKTPFGPLKYYSPKTFTDMYGNQTQEGQEYFRRRGMLRATLASGQTQIAKMIYEQFSRADRGIVTTPEASFAKYVAASQSMLNLLINQAMAQSGFSRKDMTAAIEDNEKTYQALIKRYGNRVGFKGYNPKTGNFSQISQQYMPENSVIWARNGFKEGIRAISEALAEKKNLGKRNSLLSKILTFGIIGLVRKDYE